MAFHINCDDGNPSTSDWYDFTAQRCEHKIYEKQDQRESFQKTQQQIGIGTVFVNSTGLFFEVKAMGVNTLSIDLIGTKFYIDGVPKTAGAWLSPDCTSKTLKPGASCYGQISDYKSTNCHIGEILRVAISWGAETSKKIKGCTKN